MKTKILLVDDDPNIRAIGTALYLEKEGFDVTDGGPGRRQALKEFKAAPPNLMLLDRDAARHGRLAGVPGSAQGFQYSHHHAHRQRMKPLTRCWAWNWARTIISSSPLTPKELVARIKAVIRRYQNGWGIHGTRSWPSRG